MKFEHPAAVIDETVENLEYLADFFLDDIEHCIGRQDQLTAQAKRALAALEASQVLLPRLRIVRSNYVADSRLPDTDAGAELLSSPVCEDEPDASEAPAAPGYVGVLR